MKGLIFSEVTIEEQIVWPKADSGPQKTRKKIVWRVQQQENIYRITLCFLVRKKIKLQNLIERRWDKGRELAEKQTQKRSRPPHHCLEEKKKLGCLLFLLKVAPLRAGEGHHLIAHFHCFCWIQSWHVPLAGSASAGSQLSCKVVPFQVHRFIGGR